MEHDQEAEQHQRQPSTAGAEEENPACQSCRRRKLKCSREVPACSQCSRLDATCVYSSRQKPGLKTGAVEALNRRVEALEELLCRDGEQQLPPTQVAAQQSICHVSMLLVKELKRIRQDPCSTSSSISCLDQLPGSAESRKRKREDTRLDSPSFDDLVVDSEDETILSSLPPPTILDEVVETYFQKLHPWIPFLHQPRFIQQLEDPSKKKDLAVILQAMVCATLRFIPQDRLGADVTETERQIRRARQAVLLKSMECPSIVHLQALIIIAFDHLGSGDVEKAWSLIGSLTRTVEYLRLTVEPDEMMHHPLHKPLSLLPKSTSWTEVEGRRRLFWNIFLLDRLCSVTTGWSTSLTSDDVHRKLPVDGGIWKREERSDTPYFGIWNKSAARIGNSIAYIPAHYPTPDREADHDNARSPGLVPGSGLVDTSKLGAFAYCIEATESLSQVTTFFLQQRVDFKNRQGISSWLTRFKELDLRLVHWKMFLPQQWKDSNISRDSTLIDMDPNLTLAHITHNTSMILLHQHIAFPPPEWIDLVKLPSPCSAETCYTAAIETVAITKKYLKYKPVDIVNSQFALCAFVAGRILLVHWRASEDELAPEYFDILESLKQMSARWQRPVPSEDGTNIDASLHSLAGDYALKLEYIHSKLLETPLLYLSVLGYSKLQDTAGLEGLLPQLEQNPDMMSPRPSQASPHIFTNSTREHATSRPKRKESADMSPQALSPESHMTMRNPQPTMRNNSRGGELWQPMNVSNSSPSGFPTYGHIGNIPEAPGNYDHIPVDDELTAMSNILLGQQFLEMDRVITFDGTNFAIDMNQWQGMN